MNTTYRPDGQVDANGNTTRLVWDADGKQLEQVTDALEHATTFDYDGNLRLLSSVDVAGRKTTYVYNSDNRQPTMVLIAEDADPYTQPSIDIETVDNWSAIGSAAKAWLIPQVDTGGRASLRQRPAECRDRERKPEPGPRPAVHHCGACLSVQRNGQNAVIEHGGGV